MNNLIPIQCVAAKKYVRFHSAAVFPKQLPVKPVTGEFIHEINSKGSVILNSYPIIAISHIFIENVYYLRLHLGCPVEYPNE